MVTSKPPEDPQQSEDAPERGRQAPRRTSFGFLRRAKSMERQSTNRSTSGGKLSKKAIVAQRQQELLNEQRNAPTPKLPEIMRGPTLTTFGGEDARPDSVAIMSNQAGGYHARQGLPEGVVDMTRMNAAPRGVPVPPIPGESGQDEENEMTESVTNRGRYSYASSHVSTINSPRRVRRRKDPTPFNILIVGARNSGKSSFLEFLRQTCILPPRKQRLHQHHSPDLGPQRYSSRATPSFTSHYLETEMADGERIGLTLWDSEGLDKSVVDLQLEEMTSFVESKFEETFAEERKVMRTPGSRDTHIHCVFLILDPLNLDASLKNSASNSNGSNGVHINGNAKAQPPPTGLEEALDLQVLRALGSRTTVVPLISKADTITTSHMLTLKRAVWASLQRAGLNPLAGLDLEEGGEEEDGSSGSDYDAHAQDSSSSADTIRRKTRKKHDSKRFDERDEDAALGRHTPSRPAFRSRGSHLDSPSSSSDSSPSREKHARHHARNDSSTLPTSHPYRPDLPPVLPLSILSPDFPPSMVSDSITHPPNRDALVRTFPWGIADPLNPAHCDFPRLRELVFDEWRAELRRVSRERWYEAWRSERLAAGETMRAMSLKSRGGGVGIMGGGGGGAAARHVVAGGEAAKKSLLSVENGTVNRGARGASFSSPVPPSAATFGVGKRDFSGASGGLAAAAPRTSVENRSRGASPGLRQGAGNVLGPGGGGGGVGQFGETMIGKENERMGHGTPGLVKSFTGESLGEVGVAK